MSNLELWDSVQETNPADTKPVAFGRKFTAIDAYSQIKKATEAFGQYGTAWGLINLTHTFVPGTNLVLGVAEFFTPNDGLTNISSSVLHTSDKGKVDDDFAKKLETDMITKALSRLGFNADVFMGKFDDNKYIDQMNEKFKQISPEPIRQAAVDGAYKAFKEVIDADVDVMDFKRVQDGYKRLTQDEQMAVFSKFGSEKPEDSTKGYKAVIKELLAMTEDQK